MKDWVSGHCPSRKPFITRGMTGSLGTLTADFINRGSGITLYPDSSEKLALGHRALTQEIWTEHDR